MKRTALALLAMMLAGHALAEDTHPDAAPPDIQHYMDAGNGDKSDITDARADMIRDRNQENRQQSRDWVSSLAAAGINPEYQTIHRARR